ncbi:hypothetical protein STAN_5682 [Streptomyces sp. CBMAI 2042]|nr:hypothetical protein STAN_5682 [Streptomyces sp. CBMAI 2042]
MPVEILQPDVEGLRMKSIDTSRVANGS